MGKSKHKRKHSRSKSPPYKRRKDESEIKSEYKKSVTSKKKITKEDDNYVGIYPKELIHRYDDSHNKYEKDISSTSKPKKNMSTLTNDSAHIYNEEDSVTNARKDQSNRSTGSDNSSGNIKKSILFNWKDHAWELNKLFFSEDDVIQRDTEDYRDFWKFLHKYEAMSKEKNIKEKCDRVLQTNETETPSEESAFTELPKSYDKRYTINFALSGKHIKQLKQKLPPLDMDNINSRLSDERLEEFKRILLLYLDFIQKQKFNKIKSIRQSQKSLPIADYKDHILETVANNTVTILAGDTGCGKSTQIPQYLLNAGYVNIACTQPRRIACISLCKRVAHETLNEYGSDVGFQIRFEKSKTHKTKIIFLTEGLLLRQIGVDPLISLYDVIILDEIHERHLQTDFLLGVVKCLIVQRPCIKIILMSATINIDLFSNYFMGKAPVIQVPGRLYPIALKYFPISILEKKDKIDPSPYVRILSLIDNKYSAEERGDVLIFMSGLKEITAIIDAAKIYGKQSGKWVILPLHSTLSLSEQEKVFDIPPAGVRKCIVSTNIAETSVTIDGIRFVVDSGKVKEMSHDPIHKMQKLKEFWISQASAEQRKGRAGRTGPGVCYRLYSESEYQSFAPYTTPEIMRVPLDSLVLQMMAMGLPTITLFPFIEPPAQESLQASIRSLKEHSAVTDEEDLTTMGNLLSQLPMDITLGKMLIIGSLFQQLGPVLSLAACLSVQTPFTNKTYRDGDCLELVKMLTSSQGDPFTLLNVYREWLTVKINRTEPSRNWCRKRGLEEQRFYEITKLRQQFSQMLQDSVLQGSPSQSPQGHSSSERSKRFGELSQLKQMKRHLHRQGPRKAQILKLDLEGGVAEPQDDNEDVGDQIKEIDFKIRYDDGKLKELLQDTHLVSFKDLILLKVILCSGLYPKFALGDEHNTYQNGSDQFFHTPSKAFVGLHPNGVFANDPGVLQLTEPDIMSGISSERFPVSCRHQFLCFVTILETDKPFLMNTFRIPIAQSLMLFACNIDTNADLSTVTFDDFIELRFPDCSVAQDLICKAVEIRSKWKMLLESKLGQTPQKDISHSTLQRELNDSLVHFYQEEPFYSVRRLLKADVKVLHKGPGPEDATFSSNPFTGEPCVQNDAKGGFQLTDFLTYNSVLDPNSNRVPITSYDSVCPICSEDIHLSTLERLHHVSTCPGQSRGQDKGVQVEPVKKLGQLEYSCPTCSKTFFFSATEVLRHKKVHSSS